MEEIDMFERDPSHFTILGPQDSDESTSYRIATDYFNVLIATDKDRWASRKDFFFATLLFCANLGNLWRFPKQMLVYGRGTFVYLYIFFILTCGSSLMFFEVALGQYSTRGFSKVFAMCPIFEGISYAMAIYCNVMNILYNHWNIYNFHYMILGLSPTMPFASGINNSTGVAYEQEFFERKIMKLVDAKGDPVWFNFINFSILILIWGVIIIVAIKRSHKNPKLVLACCALLFVGILTLFVSAIVCFPHAVAEGLSLVFIGEWFHVRERQTWSFAFEQSLIALGLGMGPLINFGSFSKFRSPAHIDCLYINLMILIITLMFAVVISIIAAQLASEIHLPVDVYVTKYLSSYHNVEMHVLLSQMFSRMPNGFAQGLMVLCYFMFFCISLYCAEEYMKTLEMLISSTIMKHQRHRVNAVLLTCVISLMSAIFLLPSNNYYLHTAIDKTFVGLPLVFIILCELVAVAYIYSVYNFCDDIEFMLGFIPNFYHQISWLCLPVLMVTFIITGTVAKSESYENYAEVIWCFLILVLTVGPIVGVAIFRVVVSHRHGNTAAVFGPKDMIESDDSDSPSDTTISRFFKELENKMQQSDGNDMGLLTK